MKILVDTRRTLQLDDDSGLSASIDCDSTTRIHWGCESNQATRWMDRADLLRVRALINRALALLP